MNCVGWMGAQWASPECFVAVLCVIVGNFPNNRVVCYGKVLKIYIIGGFI